MYFSLWTVTVQVVNKSFYFIFFILLKVIKIAIIRGTNSFKNSFIIIIPNLILLSWLSTSTCVYFYTSICTSTPECEFFSALMRRLDLKSQVSGESGSLVCLAPGRRSCRLQASDWDQSWDCVSAGAGAGVERAEIQLRNERHSRAWTRRMSASGRAGRCDAATDTMHGAARWAFWLLVCSTSDSFLARSQRAAALDPS